jgi:hypothetical protein
MEIKKKDRKAPGVMVVGKHKRVTREVEVEREGERERKRERWRKEVWVCEILSHWTPDLLWETKLVGMLSSFHETFKTPKISALSFCDASFLPLRLGDITTSPQFLGTGARCR